MLTYETWDEKTRDFDSQNPTKGALHALKWAYETYEDDLVYACSFGIEGSVLVDLVHQVKPHAQIVFLDTHLHFLETYEVIEEAKKRYPSLRIKLKAPALSLEEQASKHGEELWKLNPNQCCTIRKVIPLEEELNGVTAWLSGLRREQSPTRQNTQFVNRDERFKSIKICPLIHWTWKDIWRYAHKHDLPYNKLHDNGYPSIGCEPCTQAALNADDLRSGRWSGLGKLECGLHQSDSQ
ncbi:phosphoadenylyl-sulfate reductase [Bacillus sp. E(2018)]|uniref:phosphoadenylyl-sulfate reductase n=1 Tax=Bacillus sp. E(2018) TaxID=2502239 RepID=UPI0010FA3523|nr:phosphoadenylyl-sulfate reductase [Bacillus sp. E(2018)]